MKDKEMWRVMGFAPSSWKNWNLVELEEGCEEKYDVEEKEEEEGGGVVGVERKGGKSDL